MRLTQKKPTTLWIYFLYSVNISAKQNYEGGFFFEKHQFFGASSKKKNPPLGVFPRNHCTRFPICRFFLILKPTRFLLPKMKNLKMMYSFLPRLLFCNVFQFNVFFFFKRTRFSHLPFFYRLKKKRQISDLPFFWQKWLKQTNDFNSPPLHPKWPIIF